MPRPRRRLRRRTFRLRRRWHRLTRPLRRPARGLVALAVLAVALAGLGIRAAAPVEVRLSLDVDLGPDSTAVVEVEPRGDASLAGLRSGDRLLAVDGELVTAAWAARMARGDGTFLRPPGDTVAVRVQRGGQALAATVVANRQDEADARRVGLSDRALMRANQLLFLLAVLSFVVAGGVLVVRSRARGYHASLGVALLAAGGAFGFDALATYDNEAGVSMGLIVPLMVVAIGVFFGALPAVARALVRFPDGRYGPRWTRRIGRVLLVSFVALLVFTVAGQERAWLSPSALNASLAAALTALGALPVVGLVQKYRRAEDAVVRQQMKWAILPTATFVALLLTPYLQFVVPAVDAGQSVGGLFFNHAMSALLSLSLAAVPLAVLAGAYNFRPWDADLWIARSAALGAATLGLAAAFAGGAEALRVGLRASMGEGAEAVAAALAAVVALAVFNPLREWVTKRADADLLRTRERLTERLPLLLAGRQVVASPEEIGRVALAAVRDALATDRAAVLDLDPGGWEVVAADGVSPEAALAWAEAALDAAALPAASAQVWEDPLFVLRVPLRSAEDEVVGVLALGTHGKGRGYSTEERRALDAASRSLAEALRVAERRTEAEALLADRLAALTAR